MMERISVPFRLDSYSLNLNSSIRTDGVLRLESDTLIIESRETTMNLATLESKSGEVREVRIPLDEIESVEVARRWLWLVRLRIRTNTLAALRDVPGAVGNEFTVRIRRNDFERARSLAVNAALELSNRQLRRLEEKADD